MDSLGTAARFGDPRGLAIDADDTFRIRKIVP